MAKRFYRSHRKSWKEYYKSNFGKEIVPVKEKEVVMKNKVVDYKFYIPPGSNVGVRDTKFLVWERDGWKCQYCGEDLWNGYAFWKRWVVFGKFGYQVPMKNRPTVDHVKAKSKGGDWSLKNLVTSCYTCNQDKADFPAKLRDEKKH